MSKRKRVSAKKASSKKGMGRGSTDNMAKRSLAVYSNPFSTATLSAKVPDGRTTLSVGVRHQAHYAIKNENAASVITIYVHPTLTNGLTIENAGNEAGTAVLEPYEHLRRTRYIGVMSFDDVNGSYIQDVFPQGWRIVSSGLKMFLTNNWQENSGWFEAARINYTTGSFIMGEDPLEAGHFHHMVDPALIDQTNLITQPSYVSGKLSDINAHLFQLKPRNTDHEFQNPNQLKLNFDGIIIRIHGAAATRLVLHQVTNFEFEYSSDNYLSRFQNEGQKSLSALERTQTNLMKDVKAAKRFGFQSFP